MADEPKRFVIQKQVRQRDVHWDFMIEQDGSLHTWRINTAPDKLSQQPVHAERIQDHQLRFLTYEGPVNNGKATVQIADAGTYRIVENDKGNITLDMDGRILQGKFSLEIIDNKNWQILPVAP